MRTYYFAVRLQQSLDGTNKFTISSAKESKTEVESMVSLNISADRNNTDLLFATNLVLCSDGSIGIKNYFSHDKTAEVPVYYDIDITQYTEESGKDLYKAYYEYDNGYDAETQYWLKMGNGKKDATVDGLMNIVLNWHGGAEKQDYWVQYPEETESEG